MPILFGPGSAGQALFTWGDEDNHRHADWCAPGVKDSEQLRLFPDQANPNGLQEGPPPLSLSGLAPLLGARGELRPSFVSLG
ncbi:hypothetical protein BH10PLA2_BH10PLA2_29430 [soil metagenome]